MAALLVTRMTQEDKLEEELTGVAARVASSGLLSEPAASIVHLPSKGVLYKNEPALADIHEGSISVRPMTMRELELFMRPELIESGTLIDAVFKKCIKSSIDPKYLLTSDRTYLLIWIRAQSFGSRYKFKFNCGGCKRSIQHVQDLGKLTIKTLDEIHGARDDSGHLIISSVKKIKEPFVYFLPHAKLNVGFKLARGIDESEKSRDDYYDRVKKEQNRYSGVSKTKDGRVVIRNIDPNDEEPTSSFEDTGTQPNSLLQSFMKQIAYIEGIPEDRLEEALTNMVAGDVTGLQQAMYDADSGIDMRITVNCPDKQGCGHRNEITVPFTESFFRSSL